MSQRLRRVAERWPLATFVVLTIALGWLVALPLVLSPAGLGLVQVQVPGEWLMLVACTPTAAALWVQWLRARSGRICRVGAPWSRVLAGCVFGVVLVLMAFAIVPALVLSNGAVGDLTWPAVLVASAPWWINPLNLLGGPLNEEPGWRGFALPLAQARFGALGGSLLLGVLWTAWHAPLFLVRDYLSVPVWAFTTLLLCLSVLMTWVVNLSGGSVVPPILMHATFNSSFPVLVGLCRGVATREPGLVWYVVGVVTATGVVVGATRGRLGRQPAPARTAAL